jgi:hypothetical protein
MSTIKVDTITDEAGTGAPTFSQGAAVTGNLSATGTITGGAFSGSGAGLTGIDAFKPVAVTGTTPSLNVGSYNFFNNGSVTANTTVSFASVPTNARWTYSFTSTATNPLLLSVLKDTGQRLALGSVNARGMAFRPTGLELFILDSSGSGSTVSKYTLSTAWDISTATAAGVTSTNLGNDVMGLSFSSDGTKMYSSRPPDTQVRQFPLSTAWDITTAGSHSVWTVPGGVGTYDAEFSPDGTKVFVAKGTTKTVVRHDLSTAWDITTAGSAHSTLDTTSAVDTQTNGVVLSPDGYRLVVLDDKSFHSYTLTTAYDLSTASYDNIEKLPPTGTSPKAITSSLDGVNFYSTDASLNSAYQYSIASGPTITLPSSVQNSPTKNFILEQVTYEFFTMDGGTTVKLIGEEVV